MGRRKYTTEYLVDRGIFPPTWKDDLIEMGKEGKNKIYFSNHLNITRDTFYKLMDRDPEFNKIVKQALKHSEQWWIENIRESFDSGTSQKVNSTLWKYYMENVFREDWRTESNIDITSKGEQINDNTISVEIIKKTQDDGNNESIS